VGDLYDGGGGPVLIPAPCGSIARLRCLLLTQINASIAIRISAMPPTAPPTAPPMTAALEELPELLPPPLAGCGEGDEPGSVEVGVCVGELSLMEFVVVAVVEKNAPNPT